MDIYDYFFTFWFYSAYLVLLKEPLLLIFQIISRPRVSCTIFWNEKLPEKFLDNLIIWSAEQPEHSSVTGRLVKHLQDLQAPQQQSSPVRLLP